MREVLFLGTPEAEESDKHLAAEFGCLGNTCGDLHYPPLDTVVRLTSPVRTCSTVGIGVCIEEGKEGWDAYLKPGDYIFHRLIHKSLHGAKFLEGVSIDEGTVVLICIGQPESISMDWRGSKRG